MSKDRKSKDNFKVIVSIIVIVFLIPVLIRFVFSVSLTGDEGSSFWGSYLGGVIGAITALSVVSIQIKNEAINKKEDDIKRIRPYLVFRVTKQLEDGSIIGEIHNVGFHTACDISIKNKDLDHPDDDKGWYFLNDAISAGNNISVRYQFNLSKTLMYEFEYKDLLNNSYIQQFRYASDEGKFYSLAPEIIKKD